MTDEQIKQNAFDEAVKYSSLGYEQTPFADGYIAGVHSCDEKIAYLTYRLNDTAEKLQTVIAERNNLRNPWISVKDRLPENDDLVFTIYWVHKDFYSIELSSYNPKTREWDCGEFGYRISHWMPIPELKGK